MKIGVDLDEVLAEFMNSLVEFYNIKYEGSVKRSDAKNYELWKTFKLTREETSMIVEDFYKSEIFRNLMPVSGSQSGVETLVQDHELFVITSRPSSIEMATKEWLGRHFSRMFSDVYFSSHSSSRDQNKSKAVICDYLDIDLMIEDHINYALDISNTGRKVLLLDCPWNQVNNLPINIIRVKSWQEILEKIS